MTRDDNLLALVTGGSSGLGRALAHALDRLGWQVVTDARDAERLADAMAGTGVLGLPGDVADATHRAALVEMVRELGGLDLVVLNASTLGPLPMRELPAHDDLATALTEVLATNAVAHAALLAALTPYLHEGAAIVGISSDAAVQHYPTWGLYGASKAALDHVVLTVGAETGVPAYAVDPGDMRTPMHQDAFPGEDIGDRPLPETVVPRLLALLEQRPESGRVVAAEVEVEVPA